jgi:signal transduction histidine kinase/class 3 adenylate cyclase/CheY-like chemotaxis protein
MGEKTREVEDLVKEIDYYKHQLDGLAGENLKLDYTISGLRHELQQKRQGFALLSALQQSVGAHNQISSIFQITMGAINSTLGMDKTIVFSPTQEPNVYRPSQWLGYREDDTSRFATLNLEFPPTFAAGTGLILANRVSEKTTLIEGLRQILDLPFFICLPVLVDRAPIGLLLSGRMKEARPLYPPLDQGDVDTFQAIAGLISGSVQNTRLAVLTEMDRLKTEFFANISHEFRTPIALTVGPLQQILADRRGPVPEIMRADLNMMLRNQERLLNLVNQLLDLAKFDAGRMELHAIRVDDVNRIVEESTTHFEEVTERRGIALKLSLDQRLRGAELYVDIEKLERLISNLLSNAIKFTKAGNIEVSTLLQDGSFRLTISDTGVGIKTDELPHVFDRFYQADGGASREYAGTGIGLALVKEIVTLHGGTVSVRSQYGEGTAFDVIIPLGKAHLSSTSIIETQGSTNVIAQAREIVVEEGAVAQESADKANREAEASLNPKLPTLLYADDNPDLRAYVRQLLAPHYNVFLAVDGRDGLEKVQRYHPDLILSDQMMPRMSGRALLRAVRDDNELRSTAVIFLTARAGTEARIESLDAGADDYIAKPFDEQELQARIRNLIRVRSQERDLAALNKRLADWNETLEERIHSQVSQLENLSRLKRFFSPQLADLIVAGGTEDPLRSHRRELAVVFLDLRGFTAFAEMSEPEEVMAVLREYHAAMGLLIQSHEGTLERFTGDGMVVFFNDPLPVENAPERAVRMAMAMKESVGRLSTEWRKRDYQLDFGVGVTQGYATIGAIGFEGRLDYGAIGSVINLASRLCDEAKPGQVLAPRRLFSKVEKLVEAEPIGDLELKGFHNPVSVYNLLRLKD